MGFCLAKSADLYYFSIHVEHTSVLVTLDGVFFVTNRILTIKFT
jgi:hypothetical protein